MTSYTNIEMRHTGECFSPNRLQDQEAISACIVAAIEETYVSHESRGVNLSFSILSIHRSQRTMLQFHYGELSRRCRGLLMDREERASVGRPFATGHLQSNLGLEAQSNKIQE